MKLFGRRAAPESAEAAGTGEPSPGARQDAGAQTSRDEAQVVLGERSTALAHRARSLQSRITDVLAIGLMGALGLGLLGWYYAHTLTHRSHALALAQRAARAQSEGDAPLPPLGHFSRPELARAAPNPSPAPSITQRLLGPPPALPGRETLNPWNGADGLSRAASVPVMRRASPGPRMRALDRELQGPVFAQSSGSPSQGGGQVPPEGSTATGAAGSPPWSAAQSPDLPSGAGGAGEGDRLAALLKPSVTPAVSASVLPTQRFLLPKGAFVDCTLETAIDSTLPGMTTCVTATDTFSTDGTVVLLERGTKLVGETRGEVAQGQARVFVLWTEARTPTGVVVPLDSPATDALGRSGLSGKVDTHFWARFGAAILISVIDGGVQAGVQASGNGGTVIVSPQASEQIMTDVLRGTIDIPPTIVVPQGKRIEVLVARDVDFRSVYRLTLANFKGSP